MGCLAVWGLSARSTRRRFSLTCQLQALILSVQTFKLSCRESRTIRDDMGSHKQPFFQASLVPVRAPLAFGPPLWASPSYQDGASGAPTRRRQAPNTRTLGP